MTNWTRRLPSPALVVAAIALVAALAGSAVALPGKNKVDKNDLKKNVVKSKNVKSGAITTSKIANGAVDGTKIGTGAVDSAKIADGTIQAADLNANALPARAYGLVLANNDVDESLSKGLTDAMVELQNDIYCFYNLPFQPRNVQVTLDRTGIDGDTIAQAALNPPSNSGLCSGDEDASVRMWDVSLGDEVIAPDFYIAFE